MLLNQAIRNLVSNKNVISFIGNEKESGKTTCLKVFLDSLDSFCVGVTSVGVDAIDTTNPKKFGESYFVKEGTIIATATQTLPFSDITKEILYVTNIMTPLGKVIIIKAKSSGNVTLAGPSTIDELGIVIKKMQDFGAQKVLIDGSFNRRSIADPIICDGVVITFAVPDFKNTKTISEKIFEEVSILTIHELQDKKVIEIIHKYDTSQKYFLIDQDYHISFSDPNTDTIEDLENLINNSFKNGYIIINGALTKSILLKLLNMKNKLSQSKYTKIVIQDATRLFINKEDIIKLNKIGISIISKKKINVIGIMLNTLSQRIETREFDIVCNAITQKTNIPVLDLKGGCVTC